jgi:cell division protein FtsW
MTGVAGLLLLEPDYGTTVVLFATVLGMLYLGGVPQVRFWGWVMAAGALMVVFVLKAPYRVQRLATFMDPWADPFDKGFQLTQALIAIGRGEWLGVGLGASVQKLFYLPEAHTDFLFAVLAEELGIAGMLVVIGLFSLLVWRGFRIAGRAERRGQMFGAYLAYGLVLVIGLQALVNIGVNLGALPTKGLTLPLMSYGGSSMVASCLALGMLLRIDRESRGG